MFVPTAVRHPYSQRHATTFAVATLLLLVNAFFLLVPSWMLETKYSEMLLVLSFNAEDVHPYQYLSYALLYPNAYLFVFDLIGLLFFGCAVESRIGPWRTVVLILASVAFSVSVSSLLQEHYDLAGMTGAVFGVLGACFAIYAFSETNGFALLPVPPTYKLGFTYTWTILILLAYFAGGMAWSFWASRQGHEIQMMGIAGLLGGFVFGIAFAAVILRAKLPLLHPMELDPTRQMKAEDLRRREELERALAEDGYGSSNSTAEENKTITSPGESMDHSLAADLPMNTEINFGSSSSSSSSSSIESRKQGLIKLLQLRDYPALSHTYEQFIQEFPHACLASGPQFDLATALEKAFFFDLALHAYERLIQCHPHAAVTPKALLQAGRICMRADGNEREAIQHLEAFLKSNDIPRDEFLDAHDLIKRATAKITGNATTEKSSGLSSLDPPRERNSELPSEAPSSSMDLLMQEPMAQAGQPQLELIEAPAPIHSEPVQTTAEPVFYTLILKPKTAISLTALTAVMLKRWEMNESGVRSRLKRQKGIIERHISRADALALVAQCAEQGQQVIGVAEIPQDQYEGSLEIDSVRILQDRIEWRSGSNSFRSSGENIRLISGGLVRMHSGEDRIRAQVCIYLNQPHVQLRIRETFLQTQDDPELNTLTPREALKRIMQRVVSIAPHAQITHAFQRTFGDANSTSALLFDDAEEFDFYNYWSLLAWKR